MEIGNEIGQKIRSAIKAKLVDLGAYVDDELPDYVMVMVANKKSEAQMCEDLSLFLGANTSKFTAWLHGLLQKLLSITSEPNSMPKQSDAKNAPASVPVHAAQAVVGAAADAKTMNEPTVPSFSAVEAPIAKATKSKAVLPMKKRDVGVKQPEAVIDDEPVIKLSLEHDEFEEESRGIGDNMKDAGGMGDTGTAKVKVDSVKKMAKESIIEKALKGAADLTEEYIPEPVKPVARNLQKQSSKDATEPHKVSSSVNLGVRGETRKRPHGLESSVGAVVKHDVDEKDYPYDPYRPAIGNVASVVKVTERKSSVPPAMQANKMLLFQAMKEAEQSVSQIRKISAASESVKAVSSRPVASIRSRLGVVKTSKPAKSDARISVSASVQKESRAVSVKPTKEIPLTSVSTKASVTERLSEDRKPEPNFDEDEEENGVRDTAPEADQVVMEAEEDTRKVRCSSSGTVTLQAQAKLKQEMERRRKELDEDLSEELQLRRILMQQQWPILERAASPKFVVTLDGVCQNSQGDLHLEELEEEEELSVPMMEPVPRNVVHVKPQVIASQLVEEDTANDAEYESEFEPASKKARATERCKFWPSCKNGDACLFHHPSIPCKMFPSCRFGEKCLYVHPNCKFDGVCRNPSCSYTHSTPHSTMPQPVPIIMPIRMPVYSFPAGPIFAPVRTRAPAPTHPKQIKCKFFPNCTDMNCAFAHPKPCRYGLSCTNKQTCPFSHPKLPTKKQMKWVSAPAQESI